VADQHSRTEAGEELEVRRVGHSGFLFARLLDAEERLLVPFADARLRVVFEPLARVDPRFEPRLVCRVRRLCGRLVLPASAAPPAACWTPCAALPAS